MKHLFFVATTLVLLSALHAQEDSGIAYVPPAIPQDPNFSKVSYLRLCYPGDSKSPSICLAREPKGGKPSLIESNIPADTYSDYVAMRPGRFTLHILDGKIPNDPTAEVPVERKLAEPVEVNLTGGGAFTLYVTEKEGQMTAAVYADPAIGSTGQLRIMDTSGLDGWTVRIATRKGQPLKTLWKSGDPVIGIAVPYVGVFYIEVWRTPSGSQPQQLGLFETKLNKDTAFSIVLSPGNGQGAAHLLFDSVPRSYDAEAIKAMVDTSVP